MIGVVFIVPLLGFPTGGSQDGVEQKCEPSWSFSALVYAYRVPDVVDYLQPTLTADHDWLHLEARYNYEDRRTGSAWLGYNFSVGEELKLEVTLMLGGVFGDTTGIAPGFEATLTYGILELYSESEYVFETRDYSESFMYTWSELTLSPTDWLQFGLVVQRTKVFETGFKIQRGVLVRLTFDPVEITGVVFNPGSHPIYVLGLGLNF